MKIEFYVYLLYLKQFYCLDFRTRQHFFFLHPLLLLTTVTYFVGAGYGLAGLAYFMVRGQEYQLLGLSASMFLRAFYRHAKKLNFDVETFNALIEEKTKTEDALKALRDPHRLMLPKADTEIYQKKSDERKNKLLTMIQNRLLGGGGPNSPRQN